MISQAYSTLLASGEERIREILGLNVRRKEKQGQELVCDCPICGKEAHLYASLTKPVVHCFRCGFGGDWIDFLMHSRGWSFKQARDFILKEAGIAPDEEEEKEQEKKHRKERLIYFAHEFFKRSLFEEAGSRVLEYLRNVRKYNDDLIRAMELGAYVDREGLIRFLSEKGFTPEEIQSVGLLDPRFGKTHVLSVPWQDASGRIVGFSFRTIDKSEPKYLNLAGFKKSEAIVGIDIARFWCQREDMVVMICEGVLDALHWNARSKGNIVAIAVGGTEISEEQWKIIRSLSATICIAFDNDEAGRKATEKLARALANRYDVFIANYPDEVKDLDELLVKGKLSELTLVPLQHWLVRRIAGKYTDSEMGRMRGLKECLSVASLTSGVARERFVDEIARTFGYDPKVVEQEIERRDVKEVRSIVSSLVRSLKENKNDPERVQEILEDGLKKLKPKAFQIEAYTFEEYAEELKSVPGGYETGFKKLDELVKIRSGTVTVIAGRPRHGKTSLMLNILVRMIKKYPDKSFYFFSYELPRSLITTMILMILAGKVLDEKHNVDRYIEYIKTLEFREQGYDDIDDAIATYKEWVSEGRLYIIDTPLPDKDLAFVLSNLDGVVFIDYVQKIPTVQTNTLRYVEVQKIMERIRETAVKANLPIVVGAQTGRQAEGEEPQLHHLRESGDIEQDASVVIGMHNYKYDTRDEAKKFAEENLVKLIVLKNRFGATGEVMLKFDGKVFRFYDT